MDPHAFNDYEKSVLHFLAKYPMPGTHNFVSFEAFPDYRELGRERFLDEMSRLRDMGYVRFAYPDQWIINIREVHKAVDELDNPPPEDHPKGVKTWLHSQWWYVPVYFFPALVGYLTIIWKILQWTGILQWMGISK